MESNREIWRSIDGYVNYEVSTHGRVRNATTGRILNPADNGGGYLRLTLCRRDERKLFLVHRLVAQEFLDNPDELPYVDHIDNNKRNNLVSNLRWCSSSQNISNSRKCAKPTSSIYKGVYFHKVTGKWQAYIRHNYRRLQLGLYNTEKEAGLAYNRAASEYFGEFAKLNIIED